MVLVEAMKVYPNVKIVGGGCHPFLRANNRGLENTILGAWTMETRDAVSGYSWMLDWQTWYEFGCLDAVAEGVRQSEDYAYCQKIIKAGYEVGSIVPEVIVHTGITDTFGATPPGSELMRTTESARKPGILFL